MQERYANLLTLKKEDNAEFEKRKEEYLARRRAKKDVKQRTERTGGNSNDIPHPSGGSLSIVPTHGNNC